MQDRRTMTQPPASQPSAPVFHGDPSELPADPDLIPGMPYRHYKGGAYSVTGIGRFEADLAPVVVYRAMRDPSLLWVRRADVFSEPVATPQGEVPRFAPDWPVALACLDFLPRQAVLDVLALHDTPYRHYHDRRHILEMFEAAHARGIALDRAQALAVLCHDAVYVAGCEHNEAASAALLDTVAPGEDRAVLARAAQIVLDTRGHRASIAGAGTVLDLDLLRLAAPSDVFDSHSLDVFAENRALLAARTGLTGDALQAEFKRRRAAFLHKLAQRPQLFLTDPFADCEAPARANIARIVSAAGAAHD
jgi:predicted metal-dependent HD superfamily phosphohydrolase